MPQIVFLSVGLNLSLNSGRKFGREVLNHFTHFPSPFTWTRLQTSFGLIHQEVPYILRLEHSFSRNESTGEAINY